MKKADEIFVDWRDNEAIIDLMEINPEASYVLWIQDNITEEEWDKVYQYYIMTQKRFKVCLGNMIIEPCRKRGIPFYFEYPIQYGYEAEALIHGVGVCAIRIAGELAHNLDFVNTLPVEVRVCPYKAYAPWNYKPIVGGWFRPEDLEKIEAIDVCEIINVDNRKGQALYRIYAENHEWPGELYMLIDDIQDKTIYNRMIPPEFQERRSNCRMRCQSGGHCHYCETLTYLANPDLLRPVKEKIDNV